MAYIKDLNRSPDIHPSQIALCSLRMMGGGA